MKVALVAVAAVAVVALLVFVGVGAYAIAKYNDMVEQENNVDASWAEVTNQYQRKFDLIPQLLNLTDSYLNWEASTYSNITALRSQWAAALDSGDMDGLENASAGLDAQATTIIVAVENYPGLSGIVVVQDVLYEITGTENKITVARMRYNEDVRDFNTMIEKFPASLIASSFGFDEKVYFQASGMSQPS